MNYLETTIKESIKSKVKTLDDLAREKRKMAKFYKVPCPNNIALLKTYHELVKKKKIKKSVILESLLRTRPIRSLSGIVNISVLTKPYSCPGRCIYCSIHSVWGNSWRGRSPKNVVDEIEKLVIEYGINEFYFFDDSMGANKKRLGKICDEIIKRKLDIRWSPPNGIAHWTLDEKLLEKMKKAGCYRITFGIESGNLETRKFIGKPYDLSQAKKMIKHANKIGMWTICTNIIGFPYETRQQIQDTIDFAVKSGTDLAVFYLLCPHPGTKVYDIFKSEGLIDLDKIFSPYKKYQTEDFAEIGQVLAGRGAATKNFSKEELQVIVSEAYRSFLLKRLTSFLDLRRIFNKIHSWEDFLFVVKIGRNSFKVILRNISHRTFGSQMLKRDVK